MSNTEALRAAAQAALECLENLQGGCTDSEDGTVEAITVWCPEIIDALRAALSQPAASGEPVMWQYRWTNPSGGRVPSAKDLVWREVVPRNGQSLSQRLGALCGYHYRGKPTYEVRPLYTAQPAPALVPLTDAQVEALRARVTGAPYLTAVQLIRETEAAHGITPAKEAPHAGPSAPQSHPQR